jgi:hypothetical protein
MNPKKKTIMPTQVKVPFSIPLLCFGFLPLHENKKKSSFSPSLSENKKSQAFLHHCPSPTSPHYKKTKKLSLSPTYLHHNFQETRKKKKITNSFHHKFDSHKFFNSPSPFAQISST